VIKACQKYQIGSYGLSMSHDFTTGITTGLLHGTSGMPNKNAYPALRDNPWAEIFDLLENIPHLWNHPLLLPTILLQHDVYRTDSFCTILLDERANNLQHQLGVSCANGLNVLRGPYEPADGPTKHAKIDLHNLTSEMNTLLAEIGLGMRCYRLLVTYAK
jgi:hypothetical protein